jgi:hypothetical protein
VDADLGAQLLRMAQAPHDQIGAHPRAQHAAIVA